MNVDDISRVDGRAEASRDRVCALSTRCYFRNTKGQLPKEPLGRLDRLVIETRGDDDEEKKSKVLVARSEYARVYR